MPAELQTIVFSLEFHMKLLYFLCHNLNLLEISSVLTLPLPHFSPHCIHLSAVTITQAHILIAERLVLTFQLT